MMPLDYAYYYPFDAERKVEGWRLLSHDGQTFRLESEIDSEGGEFLLLINMAGVWESDRIPRITGLKVNDRSYDLLKDAEPDYLAPASVRLGLRVCLKPGSNHLTAEGRGECADPLKIIDAAVIPPLPAVPPPAPCRFRFTEPETDLPPEDPAREIPAGFTPGIGCSQTPGRFGFTKGDGMLDCAMPTLGNVDKMYLCGDPRYRKPFRWNYSTLPENAERHGSYCPANHGIEEDQIQVNHLSVRWQARFHGRDYSCTYSLGSPGVITESGENTIRISNLEHAGNYQYVLIPRPDGTFEVSSLRELEDFTMGANYLLFFGCTEFPDLPLMVVPEKQPERIEFRFGKNTGRLSEIRLHGCSRIISCTPFGIESFEPLQSSDSEFLRRAVKRCRFWSRALLAFPVECREYYRHDEKKQEVEIFQKFRYRMLSDEWGTKPLRSAPLPPAVTLCGTARFEGHSFDFPTKYGELHGRFADSSQYTLPWMECRRKFPLRESGENPLAVRGMSDYLKMVRVFPPSIQSYPFAGALLEGIALPISVMNFMTPEEQQELRDLAAERLEMACDPQREYLYPVIHHGTFMKEMPDDRRVMELYHDPSLEQRKLCNWYWRKEPFTGITYQICYLNLYYLTNHTIETGSREEILQIQTPLIENDWGVGLTFYYLYLASLATGDFHTVREHWPLIKSVFSFFEKMHDWACMGTGYSDNGILWVEGANYGAFTSFVNMAQAVNDPESLSRGRYLAAKQQALRLAVVRSAAEYFCRYYQTEPWHLSKVFTEESSPYWQHQGVPVNMNGDRFRMAGIYNLTTEGLYPELFESLHQELPQDSEIVMAKLRKTLHDFPDNDENNWNLTQCAASMLINLALNEKIPPEELVEEIEWMRRKKMLMISWRGIHIFTRRLPENYLETQLLAWNAMKQHPFWLEHWQDLRILRADWDGHCAVIEISAGKAPRLYLGCRRAPQNVRWNGKEIPFEGTREIIISPPGSGILTLIPDQQGK